MLNIGYNERHNSFVQEATKIMKYCVNKRNVKNYLFDDEEMQAIKDLDSFLKITNYGGSNFMGDIDGNDNYLALGIHVKKNINVDNINEEHECFLHHFFHIEDLGKPKNPFFIAKAILLLNKQEGFEVFYCVNQVKAQYQAQRGYKLPQRKTTNISICNCLYCDLDLNEPYASMSNKDLVALLNKEQYDLLHNNQHLIIRSGNGIHLYLPIETIDLSIEKNLSLWNNAMFNLALLLQQFNSDFRIVDCVRLLRPINTLNKKEKYGSSGKKVELISQSYNPLTLHSLDELNYAINFLLTGGIENLFSKISNEVYGQINNNNVEDGFISLENINIDVFEEYVPNVYETPHLRMNSKKESLEQISKTTSPQRNYTNNIKSKVSSTSNNQDTFQGIKQPYDELPKVMWQTKDLLFYCNNRESIEGKRNLVLFFVAYNSYYFENIRSLNSLLSRLLWINDKYVKPKIKENELFQWTNYWYSNFFTREIRTHYIKSETILKYFNFSDEEKIHTTGNYYEQGSKEYIERIKDKKKNYSLNYYYSHKYNNPKAHIKERYQQAIELIQSNPNITYKKAKDKGLCIGENQFYALRKDIQKKVDIYSDKDNPLVLEPFKNEITYEDYIKLFPCSISTFYRRKKKYNASK